MFEAVVRDAQMPCRRGTILGTDNITASRRSLLPLSLRTLLVRTGEGSKRQPSPCEELTFLEMLGIPEHATRRGRRG